MSELHIHLDAVGGIAGDMFVAALTDAMPDLRERVLADITAVLPKDAGEPVLEEGMSAGLRACRLRLAHGTGAAHVPAHEQVQGSEHATGRYQDMVARIRSPAMNAGTAEHAISILTHLAEAEAHIHAVPVDDVHFHEIADWDSLMDVVAAGSIVAAVNASWSVSELPTGSGLVHTRHGMLPVPAPATAAMLTGFRWRDDGVGGERVTPTGAAILKHVVSTPLGRDPARGRLAAVGVGAGMRELPGMPNILRAMVFAQPLALPHSEHSLPVGDDVVAIIAFDIDDMTGEEIGVAAEHLRALEGVLDVAIGSLVGKKHRPLSTFRLLVKPGFREAVMSTCFDETTTLGLRWRLEARAVLQRASADLRLNDEPGRIKQTLRPDGTRTAKMESDDLAAIGGLARRRALKSKLENGA